MSKAVFLSTREIDMLVYRSLEQLIRPLATKAVEGLSGTLEIKLDEIGMCPFGRPGDELWVREVWARTRLGGTLMTVYQGGDNRTDYGGPWKSPIHLKRKDSRLTLTVNDVRAVRFSELTEMDAVKNGFLVEPKNSSPLERLKAFWDERGWPTGKEARAWVLSVKYPDGWLHPELQLSIL